MFYPIGDDQVHGGYTPWFSRLFLVMNCLVFAYQLTLSPDLLDTFYYTYGTVPALIMNGEGYITLLTNMFLHGGRAHIVGNMLFLYVFADNIEASIGNRKFFIFYITGGLAASAAHIFFNMGSSIPAIGASGAISAVLGAYLVMFPHAKIKMLYVYGMRIILVPAFYFLGFWIVQQLISGVGSLASASGGGGVARWAHIGGFVFGRLLGLFKGKHKGSLKKSKLNIRSTPSFYRPQ